MTDAIQSPVTSEIVGTEETITLSTGTSVTFPLVYQDWTMATAVFPAPLSRVRQVLPEQLQPLRVAPRTGAVVLFSAEYCNPDPLDPYNEVGIMIPAVHDNDPTGQRLSPLSLLGLGRSGVKAYVHYLPVTTEEARSLGDVWGYPKEVAEITVEDSNQHRHVRLEQDGEHMLTLTVGHARRRRSRAIDLYAYAEQPDCFVRGRIQTRGNYAIRPLRKRASYTLGDHPRADVLRSLNLGTRPLVRVYATGVQSRFHLGTQLNKPTTFQE